ncbi:c-type cytochrome [Psychromonas antarctica]|uniref:c-type cytochrome n=1 Tax=Psychromonas antarctica TaxID=67573 RepID=UPI001EE93A76|nr:cytochrome c [Psychromonas antarctica]MCG6200138.1 cytochrome c [Psychromonas antarctica]
MKKILLVSLMFALPTLVSAANISAGQARSAACTVCHGAGGISAVPIYPNLRGQKEAYLYASLKAYKSGQRQGGLSVIMKAQADLLSDIEMANLAAYYASLK